MRIRKSRQYRAHRRSISAASYASRPSARLSRRKNGEMGVYFAEADEKPATPTVDKRDNVIFKHRQHAYLCVYSSLLTR